MKRALDVVASALGLVLTTPLLAVLAVLVRRDSPGPAFFRQERVGRDGDLFRIRKFRTMRTDVGGPGVTTAGDGRITRTGHWLRSTKLDELPQLINVLEGTMSLVGPRPELQEYVDLWPDEDREVILSVRPGVTDPASLQFRREAELLAESSDPERTYRTVVLPEKVRIYREYVESQSFLGDLRIILGTLWSVVRD